MAVKDLFGKPLWEDIGRQLKGGALDWWNENQEDIVGLTRDEAEYMLEQLKAGDTYAAKRELSMYWAKHDRESWESYRDNTTAQLRGIAARRAAVIKALEDLGRKAASIIGKAAGNVLGF